jgi:hypothetical protein
MAYRFNNTTLTAPQDIASSAGGRWTDLGISPGISDDGAVVAFSGNLSAAEASVLGTAPGPGIFISIDQGSSSRKLVRVAGWAYENNAAGGNTDGVCDEGEYCEPPDAERINAPGGNDDGFCDTGETCEPRYVEQINAPGESEASRPVRADDSLHSGDLA